MHSIYLSSFSGEDLNNQINEFLKSLVNKEQLKSISCYGKESLHCAIIIYS